MAPWGHSHSEWSQLMVVVSRLRGRAVRRKRSMTHGVMERFCSCEIPEVRLNSQLRMFRTSTRLVCPQRVALCHGQVFFLILRKNRNKKNRKSLVAPDIHNTCPAAFPHSSACDPDLTKSARSSDQVSTFWVSRNQCHDVRTLPLAKELVGNREVSRRLDNRLHNSLVLHWTPCVKQNCAPLDTN